MDKRVGFGMRLLAVLIDGAIVCVLAVFVGGALGGLLGLGVGAAIGSQPGTEGAAAVGGVLGAVAGFVIGMSIVGFLYGLIEALTGASPGKMVLSIKVGTDDGRKAPVATYLMRWAVKYSSTLLSLLGLLTGVALLGTLGTLAGVVIFIGCFLVLGSSRQAIHDLVAKTAIYKSADLL